MSYKVIRLAKRPVGRITPDVFEVDQVDPAPLEEGQVRVRQTHMSLDPAMRGWMRADKGSYLPPVELGAVMRSSGVGEVTESRCDGVEVGATVWGSFGWAEQAVVDGEGLMPLPGGLDAEAILSVLAIPGLTAAYGLFEVGKPREGETIFITGGAGSVGAMVGQMALAEGLRVVGSSGSAEKRAWMVEELGYHAAVDYRDEDLAAAVAAATPDGVDIFFENTGGPIQHVIFNRMNAFGRVVVCGMISEYNATSAPAPGPSWVNVVRKRLTIQGFTLPDHADQYGALSQRVLGYLMGGELQYRAHVLEGLESAIEGINLLFDGGNQGKLMVAL